MDKVVLPLAVGPNMTINRLLKIQQRYFIRQQKHPSRRSNYKGRF